MSVTWALPFNIKINSRSIKSVSPQIYKEIHSGTLKNFKEFWASLASELEWFKPWEKILDDSNPPFYKWFVGGEINASYLAVDRHAKTWRKNKVAIIWEGEPIDNDKPKDIRILTYGDLFREVNRTAYMMKEKLGLKKGDRIAIYLPMIPELPIFMLAAARLGILFTVVFSGFSSDALAARIIDSNAKAVITADGGWRRGKIVDLKGIVDNALEKAQVSKVVVVRRIGNNTRIVNGRDYYYDELMKDIPWNIYIEPERMRSEDPLYVLYTSGTTGKPKGIVHDIGGYMTLLHATMKWVFDVREDDIFWCTADIGWVTGHSYIVFGPLLEGLTEIMYEGALDYPQPDRWVSIVERYGTTILYTSPTAIRSFMKYGEEWIKKHDISSIRLMHSVGEPINPEAFNWFFNNVGRGEVDFGSTWWMTETGGIIISNLPGYYMIPMKPGSNGMPIPGIEADVVDEAGMPSKPEERGYLVLKNPWPGMPLTILNDPERYVKVYWSKFPGLFYAGDYAVKDEDGYFWILGRADEVIKVSGHRLGTYELESAIIEHPAVAEAAVIGIPHEVKGEVPVAFIILKQGYVGDDRLIKEIINLAREKVGPIANVEKAYVVSKLPKTRSGKIMRRVVRAVASNAEVGDITTLEDEASVDEIRRAIKEFKEELNNRSK
ncbi:acetate--CoA ligase [Acidianus sp. RZ1]|uniref:acetate--CoA ligase n=1 Tax=Acidianus sp. RZ1 TaxID=1540082 RepID=UPI001492646C|nr:acetate--CoA ligase [Acidianus sp. RZ1]NON63647.1 acetate--CoA ligase [Acidianus sp. RZ1]